MTLGRLKTAFYLFVLETSTFLAWVTHFILTYISSNSSIIKFIQNWFTNFDAFKIVRVRVNGKKFTKAATNQVVSLTSLLLYYHSTHDCKL